MGDLSLSLFHSLSQFNLSPQPPLTPLIFHPFNVQSPERDLTSAEDLHSRPVPQIYATVRYSPLHVDQGTFHPPIQIAI